MRNPYLLRLDIIARWSIQEAEAKEERFPEFYLAKRKGKNTRHFSPVLRYLPIYATNTTIMQKTPVPNSQPPLLPPIRSISPLLLSVLSFVASKVRRCVTLGLRRSAVDPPSGLTVRRVALCQVLRGPLLRRPRSTPVRVVALLCIHSVLICLLLLMIMCHLLRLLLSL